MQRFLCNPCKGEGKKPTRYASGKIVDKTCNVCSGSGLTSRDKMRRKLDQARHLIETLCTPVPKEGVYTDLVDTLLANIDVLKTTIGMDEQNAA